MTECQRCRAPSTGAMWTTPLCEECAADWVAEAPTAGEIEAKAKPEHFVVDVSGKYMAMRQLKPGLLESYYRKWTAAWLLRTRKVAA